MSYVLAGPAGRAAPGARLSAPATAVPAVPAEPAATLRPVTAAPAAAALDLPATALLASLASPANLSPAVATFSGYALKRGR